MMTITMANRQRTPPRGSFGARLRQLRASRGLSQAEFARRVGLSSRMAAYYEIQGGTPAPDLLAKFAKVLDVSVDEMLELSSDRLSTAPSAPRELRLWRKLRDVQELPERDQRLVLQLVETLLAKHRASDR